MEPPPPLPIESTMNLIFRWKAEPAEEGFISDLNLSEIHNYLKAVNDVIAESKVVKDNKATEAIDTAVARLKHEFLHLLTRATSAVASHEDVNMGSTLLLSSSVTVSSSTSTAGIQENYETRAALIWDACNDLKSIAQTMKSAGYIAELIEIYASARKFSLGIHLRELGIWKLSNSDMRDLVQMDKFKTQADKWIRAFKMFYKTLFPEEQKLSRDIFGGEFVDVCYSKSVKDAKNELMMFAEALITSRRSRTKLFKLLDLYNTLEDIHPPLAFMNFSEPITKEEVIPMVHLCFKLVEEVRETLSDFVKALVQEVSPIDKARGTIHFLTTHVMDYIRRIVDKYDNILTRLIVVSNLVPPRLKKIPDVKFAEREGQTPLARHSVMIIAVLIFNLEAKCKKSYKDDDVLVHLFMTNNLHYIIQTIKSLPKLEAVIGEDYANNLRENYLKRARTSYEKSTCKRMLRCLRGNQPQCLSKFIFLWVSSATLRKRIKTFYILFEELRFAQAKWVEPDSSQLREELRLSLVEKLVPAYMSFLQRLNSRKHPYIAKAYIKYSLEELQNLISKDFFFGI